ncbi:MAG: chloride channel protein [Alphaproteobacteria bacterium]
MNRQALLWRRYGARRTADQIAGQINVWRRRAATGVGAILLALFALFFARVCDAAQRLFGSLTANTPLLPLVLTPLAFGLAALIVNRGFAVTRGSGIPQVIAAARAPGNALLAPLVSIRTAGAKFVMTVLVLFGGGSFGREGPTVQISAAIMVATHRLFRVPLTPGVIIAGGAAGVSAAFNTPLAGVSFAIEELAAAYEQRVAVLVMAAVMIAGLTSLGIAGDYVYFGTMHETLGVGSALMLAPVVGVVGGITGGLFSRLLLLILRSGAAWLKPIKRRPVSFAVGCGVVVAALGLSSGGATFGTGYQHTRELVEGMVQPVWFLPAKFLATLASSASGVPGGVFAPSLSVGAGLGDALAPLFPNQPVGALVILGMVAHFTGVVRSPLTAVIILSEATGSHGMILPLFATALIADGVSTLICRERLYHALSRPFVAPLDEALKAVAEKPAS